MILITQRKEEKIIPEETEPPGNWVKSYNLATAGEAESKPGNDG